MSDLDANHETVGALERLVPEAMVTGGSFAGWLPHPRRVSPAEREAVMTSAREAAVAHCLRSLLRRIGFAEDTSVGTGEGGERNWPAGFVGSLTHKGTVVLGVIASAGSVQMIGIDLERIDGNDLAAIEDSIAPEGIAPGMDPETARLVLFSVKEAVFKAQYPATRRRLAFADVRLTKWEQAGGYIRAVVWCPVEDLEIRACVVGNWVVSAAISRSGSAT